MLKILLFCLPLFLHATEVAPWFGEYLEFEARASALYQGFDRVSSGKKSFSYHSDDVFTNFSLSFCPDPDWDVELEVLFADTRHRNYGFDSGKITGRYLILDDIIGDPISMTAGLSLILPIHSALRDIGSFHHGMAEFEAHAAIGQEVPYLTQWALRHYSFLALGIATQGSPWLRVSYNLERNFCNAFSAKVFLESLFGFGRRRIFKQDFRGYGAIAHRSVDAGVGLTYTFDYWGELSLQYTYRIYARNFPKNVNIAKITYYVPFTL